MLCGTCGKVAKIMCSSLMFTFMYAFLDTHVWVFKVIYLQRHSRHLLSAYQHPVPCKCKPIRPAVLSMQALFMFMFKIYTVYGRLTLIAVIVSNSVL